MAAIQISSGAGVEKEERTTPIWDGNKGSKPDEPESPIRASGHDVAAGFIASGKTDAVTAHSAAVSSGCGAEAAATAPPRQPALSAQSFAPVTPGAGEISTKSRSRLTDSDCSPRPANATSTLAPREADAEKGETCANAEALAERRNSALRAAEGRRNCGDGGETEERMRAQLADARKMVRALVGELAARDVEGDDDVASGGDDEDVDDDDEDGRGQGDEFDLTKALRQERRVVRLKQQLARARAERESLEAEMRAERAEWHAKEAESRRGEAESRRGKAGARTSGTVMDPRGETNTTGEEAGAKSAAAEPAQQVCVEAGARSEEQITASEQASSGDGCCCCGGSKALEELQAQAMVAQGEVFLVQAQLERAEAQLLRVQEERRKERERHRGALKQFVRFAMEDREREKGRAEEEMGRERREMEGRRRKEVGGLEEEVERLRREVEKGRERERERVQEAWERGRKEGAGEVEFMSKVIGEGERRVGELRARVRQLEEEKGEVERERSEWDAERREWEAERRRMEGGVKSEQVRRRAVEAALRRVEHEVVELRKAKGAVEGERRAVVREVQREVVRGRERVEELGREVEGLTGEVRELKDDAEGLKDGDARQATGAACFEEADSSHKAASVYVCRVASLPDAMPAAAIRTGAAAAAAAAAHARGGGQVRLHQVAPACMEARQVIPWPAAAKGRREEMEGQQWVAAPAALAGMVQQ
ncbi:unnamed protein product [Closterium sp. Naga37s-1]|nr:unnamed protein product [Closterium sp. Naga37s-1]